MNIFNLLLKDKNTCACMRNRKKKRVNVTKYYPLLNLDEWYTGVHCTILQLFYKLYFFIQIKNKRKLHTE